MPQNVAILNLRKLRLREAHSRLHSAQGFELGWFVQRKVGKEKDREMAFMGHFAMAGHAGRLNSISLLVIRC